MTTLRKLADGSVAQGIVPLALDGDAKIATCLIIPANCQMLQVAGPTAMGDNQVTPVLAPSANPNGANIFSFYTQVIQASNPGNIAQSLVVAAKTAPTDFTSKLESFPIYRTFQDEKQSPQALGGFAPMNVGNIQIPAGWGIWQVVSVTGAILTRNNMRFGIALR